MDFGAFSLISLMYVVIGVRVIGQMVQRGRKLWDHNFTQQDRILVDQAAFFILIPISVALHELGHAIAVWGFGKEVVDFGFYGFAGYVSYFPFGLTDVQQTIISAAGSLVNLLLCAVVLAVVLLKKPPFRAAFNEVLIQFVFLSGINAFILYPVLDLISGLNGDWRQMYQSGVPWLTGIIIALQAATIGAGYWLITNPRMKARFARLTDVPPGYERGVLGGIQPGKVPTIEMNPGELAMREAAERVSSGWQHKVHTHLQRFGATGTPGSAILLQWADGSIQHVVAVRRFETTGITELVHIPTSADGTQARAPLVLHRWPATPSADELTTGLRVAMETVERGS
jgi:hypothetical protein